MAFFTSSDEILAKALASGTNQVSLKNCMGSVNGIFKKALARDRRLLAVLDKYEYTYTKKGLIQFTYDYDISIFYNANAPSNLDDVLIVDETWDPTCILGKGSPREILAVTRDSQILQDKVSSVMDAMHSSYEGYFGWSVTSNFFEDVSEDCLCQLTHEFIAPSMTLRQYQSRAQFARRNIWKKILGRAVVPQCIKPFLALSYLAQECTYDQIAFDEVAEDKTKLPSDPIPHLAYGPLVEGRGICTGFAWAFKRLMEEAGIECMVVMGFLKEDSSVGHCWNLVKIDGQHYHVDPTWGVQSDGVFVGGLMKPDSVMSITHIWEKSNYPAAKSSRYDYDYVEDYLADHGDDFIADGAEEMYLFPESILE